jgi:hypothetical protein
MAADPNVQLENAANAFKTALGQETQPRDDHGRFASAQEEEQDLTDAEPQGEVEAEDDAEIEADAEADDESQPEQAKMPTSWSKEDADLWESLPADAQGKIAEREAQREQAVNQKFQEAANVRKATEAQLAEANANRDAYKQAIDDVLTLVQPVKPDPRAYGAGTGNYNREAYDLAVLQYEEQAAFVTQLRQQRESITAQQSEEAQRVFQEEIAAIEEVARPKFMADVPDLTDAQKAPQVLSEIVQYALECGIPPSVFEAENLNAVTSAEMHLAWKAMQYDRIKSAQGKVKASPAPKPAQPAIKPGVTISRSASKATAMRKASDRLATEGSIEAGAAVWKNFL